VYIGSVGTRGVQLCPDGALAEVCALMSAVVYENSTTVREYRSETFEQTDIRFTVRITAAFLI